ncbi:hypothetical protein [uncultured Croceitalea sp.]|uniref:hypothetical protein n=1 Tax=uncultured Croceitalea sp. TaxID=1798908 RepID=UPI0033068A3E
MNNPKRFISVFLILLSISVFAQNDDDEYITFNDRRNVVHGVYLGVRLGYGEIEGKDTYVGGLKVAYVANQQFEVGFEGKFLYSEQKLFNVADNINEDLFAAYGGLHLEPIFFSKSRVNLSFPVLIGAGVVGYIDRDAVRRDEDIEIDEDDLDAVFVLEPGINALFNISRYVQLEAGITYRFSSRIELIDSPIRRINGFSGGIGVKLGIFNMGRNRYKKKLD